MLSACDKPAVEKIVPEQFMLTGLDGTQTPIQSFRGKLLVLNVWATWCPPCRREMPSLERLSKSADPKRFAVAAIATDDSVHAVREFLAQYHITFPIYRDTPTNAANLLGVRIYPETLLIAPDGRIVQRITGEREWDSPEMLKLLEEVYRGNL